MKTLKNSILVYDSECLMCSYYTEKFVRNGVLEQEGWVAYKDIENSLCSLLDKKRARNEIALVNTKTQTVTYGIESIFLLVGQMFPFLKPLFRLKFFRWTMKRVYSFISYNRKAIAPSRQFEGYNQCTPDFNLKYRLAYIFFTWMVVSVILNAYSKTLTGIIPQSNFIREFIICGGQVIYQAIAVAIIRKDRVVHYLGNMMTISFAGSLLLLPTLAVYKFFPTVSHFIMAAYFFLVVFLMFLEHIRRTRILEINWMATATWLHYRVTVLFFIFII